MTTRIHLDSSALRSVAYSRRRRVLELCYAGGGVYHYAGVPEEVYERLLAADSAGRYVNTEIRRRYEFVRLGRGRRAVRELSDRLTRLLDLAGLARQEQR